MIYRCKCSNRHCRKRRNFTVHPGSMGFNETCSNCGGTAWAIDQNRSKGREEKLCGCDDVFTSEGRPIKPHRWGCKGCMHREELVINAAMSGRSSAADMSWLSD